MIFHELFSTTIDPADPTQVRKEERVSPYKVGKLLENGPPAKKVDVVILGDGYAKADMEKFRADAKKYNDAMFSTAPFKGRKSDFNVWTVEVESGETGIDIPDKNVWKNNALGTMHNTFGSARYVLTTDNKTLRDAAGAIVPSLPSGSCRRSLQAAFPGCSRICARAFRDAAAARACRHRHGRRHHDRGTGTRGLPYLDAPAVVTHGTGPRGVLRRHAQHRGAVRSRQGRSARRGRLPHGLRPVRPGGGHRAARPREGAGTPRLRDEALEIFFVSGDKAHFLEAARKFAGHRSEVEAADWDRVQIMGRQLAPDDPLFEGATAGGGVDLNLEGGDSRVDLELLTPPGGDEGIDLDLGEALDSSDSEAETGEAEIVDFDLEGADQGTSPTAEMPRVGDQTAEMPTVDETRLQPVSPDATAELAMDDLGIDLGDLDALVDAGVEDDVTRIAPSTDTTQLMTTAGSEMDFDLSDLTAEMESQGTIDETQRIDIDVGGALTDHDFDVGATAEIALADLPEMSQLEPVTLSEVGTKLALARAYVDMGDPDGARSILDEVLKEGSASQKQEAQRLLDSLPSA